MKTNLIEITVSGRTSSGKSEVLEVIDKALREFYGHSVKIVDCGYKGSIEDATITGQTAKHKKTVIVMFEQNITGEIKIHN